MGHKGFECRLPKKNKNQANMVDDIIQDVSYMSFVAVVSEVNLVGSNPRQPWIDTGAIRHICLDKDMFTTFELLESGEKLFKENSTMSEI